MRVMTLVCAVSMIGCGGGSASLTCDLLADADNCWATAATAAKACLPSGSEVAVFEADRQTCTFSDGTRILFDDVLPDDVMDLERFGFTIETGGSTCARFVDTFENRMELTGGGRTVISQLHPGGKFELDCGAKSYTSDFGLLFECQPGSQPTDGFDVTPDMVTFSILSVATPGELFRCGR